MKSGGFDAPTGSLQFGSQRLMTLTRPKTSRCAPATHRCLSATACCPQATTRCASTTTRCPRATTMCASATTRCVRTTKRCASTTARCPGATALCAPATVRCAVGQERARAVFVALAGVHLDTVLGREGTLRRPLSGAFPPAAGQPPRAAGQREDCASGDIAARCPYHSRTMSKCAPENCRQTFPKKFGGFHPASTRI
jgi:hypothetical protein